MKRTPPNLLVDLLAALGLLCIVLTGYILRFPLPPTTNRTHELWGLSQHDWGMIHSWAGLALLAVLFAHRVLHREWIFINIRRRFTSAQAAWILPYALAFAAGAMMFVAIEELIPESQSHGNTDLATRSTIVGFSVMMLDVGLG